MRRALGLLVVFAALDTAVAWLTGGFAFSIGNVRVSSTDATRPLLVAATLAVAYLVASGPARIRNSSRRLLAER